MITRTIPGAEGIKPYAKLNLFQPPAAERALFEHALMRAPGHTDFFWL